MKVIKNTFQIGLVLLCLFVIKLNVNAQVSKKDSLALVAFYKSTNGNSWKNNSNWLTGPVKTWYGITTKCIAYNNSTGKCISLIITHLQITNNSLRGHLPPEIGDLVDLEWIQLRGNEIGGQLPPELGKLTNLNYLQIGQNALNGNIPPQIGNMRNLEHLGLDHNSLSGVIPPEIGNLANLNSIALQGNLLSGEIPPELGKLINLETLDLRFNKFSGQIPSELGNLINLKELLLSDNQLSGEIPPELGNMINLKELFLDRNELSGQIPPELGNLVNLDVLDLSINVLTGIVPLSVYKLCASLTNPQMFDNDLCIPDTQPYRDIGRVPLAVPKCVCKVPSGGPVPVEDHNIVIGFECEPIGEKDSWLERNGNRFELICQNLAPNDSRFRLIYHDNDDNIIVGECPWCEGINYGQIYSSGNNDQNGVFDCFLKSFWRSVEPGSLSECGDKGYQGFIDFYVFNFDVLSRERTKSYYISLDGPGGFYRDVKISSIKQNEIQLYNFAEEPNENPVMIADPFEPCDIDRDGNCDEYDYMLVESSIGECEDGDNYNELADFNHDGCVTGNDQHLLFPDSVPMFTPEVINSLVAPIYNNIKFDSTTNQFQFDLAIKNISETPIFGPLRILVLELNPGPPEVLFSNSEGIGVGIGSFYNYTVSDSVLAPGETSEYKRWAINDASLVNFNLCVDFFGIVPQLNFEESQIPICISAELENETLDIITSVNESSIHNSLKPILLQQNYPNPFNQTTEIEYIVSKPGNVSIKIYDLLGQKIKSLEEGFKREGKFTFVFDGQDFPNGIYYYKLQLGDYSETKSMIKIK